MYISLTLYSLGGVRVASECTLIGKGRRAVQECIASVNLWNRAEQALAGVWTTKLLRMPAGAIIWDGCCDRY